MAKVTTNQLEKALASGVVSFYALEEPGQSVLVFTFSNNEEYVLPCIRSFCYTGSKIPVEIYEKISALYNAILYAHVFKMNYTIMKDDAPEHCKKVKFRFNVPYITIGNKRVTIKRSSSADKALSKAGYELPASNRSINVDRRTGKAFFENYPLAQTLYDDNHKQLEEMKAKPSDVIDEFRNAFKLVLNRGANGIIATGTPGTGKTIGAHILCDEEGIAFITKQCEVGTTTDDLWGMFKPREGVSGLNGVITKINDLKLEVSSLKPVAGETAEGFADRVNKKYSEVQDKIVALIQSSGGESNWEFIPGPVLICLMYGGCVILDEFRELSSAVQASLNQATDDTQRVNIYGKSYKKHKDFFMICTMNPGGNSNLPITASTKNRFVVVEVPALTEPQFVKLCQKICDTYNVTIRDDFFKKLYAFMSYIIKTKDSGNYNEDFFLTVRNAKALIIDLATNIKSYEDFKLSIFYNFVNCLSMDTDNSEKLSVFKASSDLDKKIKDLYDDCGNISAEEVEVNVSLSDIVSDDDDDNSVGMREPEDPDNPFSGNEPDTNNL